MPQRDAAVDDATVSEQLQKNAEEKIKAGRYAEAIDLYQKLVERHPSDESFALALAWAYHDNGEIEEAITRFELLFRKELSRRVFTGFAFDELARIFKRQGRYDRLLSICERAIAVQPGDYALLGELAEACLKTGQAERATAVYGQMIEMEPDSSVAYCSLGNALIALANFSEAEAAYEKAIAIEPDQAASFYGRLADHYDKAGHKERAEAAIRKSLTRDAAEPAYHLMLGDILMNGGRLDEGWAAYQTAVSLRRTSAGAYYFRLGKTLAHASHHEKACTAFQEALAAEPQNPFYLLRLAESYVALGKEALALEIIERAKILK